MEPPSIACVPSKFASSAAAKYVALNLINFDDPFKSWMWATCCGKVVCFDFRNFVFAASATRHGGVIADQSGKSGSEYGVEGGSSIEVKGQ